jgi:hypothetical protein
MWRCQKCGEDIEDSFDVCWNCGTSKEGVEDLAFRAEEDVVETEPSGRPNRCWNGFLAGAAFTAVVGYVDYVIPYLAAMPTTPAIRANLGWILAGGVIWSLLHAGGGGISGWIGGRTKHMAGAAWRGALILLATHGVVELITGFVEFLALPVGRIAAVFVNMLALGAIAGCIGVVFARPRPSGETPGEPVQYSLSEALFITVLFSVLFASLAVLSR